MSEVSTEVKSIKDIVSDKIRAEFVNLIPSEHWNKMVEEEIKNFSEGKKDYHGRVQQSELSKMIEKELEVQGLKAIHEILSSKEWQATQGPNGQLLAGEAVKKLVTEHISLIIGSFFADVCQAQIADFAYKLRQNMQNSGSNF